MDPALIPGVWRTDPVSFGHMLRFEFGRGSETATRSGNSELRWPQIRCEAVWEREYMQDTQIRDSAVRITDRP
jgi:hypothetical protein